MKKLSFQNMGIIIDVEIIDNYVYFKINQPMLRPLFMNMIKSKGEAPKEKGEWMIYEMEKDKTEEQLREFALNQFKQGGFQVVKDE